MVSLRPTETLKKKQPQNQNTSENPAHPQRYLSVTQSQDASCLENLITPINSDKWETADFMRNS